MKRKKLSTFVGLSVLAGVAGIGSFLFKKDGKKNEEADKSKLAQFYTGSYYYFNHEKQTRYTIKVTTDLQLIFNDKKMKTKVMEISEQKLVLCDQYGYQIIFYLENQGVTKLYDEADNKTYLLSATK